jgi:hypothetical protein
VPAIILCLAPAARAGLITYPNSASWTAAVSGVTNVGIPDPSPLGFINFGTGTASVTYGSLTFSTSAGLSNGTFYNIGPVNSGDPAVLSSQLETTGTPNILVTFPSPVTAFSLDYGTFQGSSVTFALSNGDSFSQGSAANNNYTVPNFVGVTDTTPFTSVLLTTSDPGRNNPLNINNVSFASIAVVPEPASLLLLGLGAVGLIALTRRRKA